MMVELKFTAKLAALSHGKVVVMSFMSVVATVVRKSSPMLMEVEKHLPHGDTKSGTNKGGKH